MREIEKKFLINEMPDLSALIPIRYERYFLNDDINNQIRIQRKGEHYELETKSRINELEFIKTKREITESEFLALSKDCNKAIIRNSYLISLHPMITIKQYLGDYNGLVRAEIEYGNIEQIKAFILPKWVGKDITNTALGSDSQLIKLNRTEFLKILESSISNCR